MIILGLDPGLATMGYGVVEKLKNDNMVAIDYGVVLTPKTESLPVRLAMLEEGINKILLKYKPDESAVDGKADKVQMMHVVTSLLHLNKIPRPDDAADALAVALCHAHTSRFGRMFGIQ